MLFHWFFSIATVVFLLFLQVTFLLISNENQIFALSESARIYLVTFLILSVFPLFLPVIRHIRTDAESSRPFLTRAGIFGFLSILTIIGILLFLKISLPLAMILFLVLISAFFAWDARLYFSFSVLCLVVTIFSLIFEQKHLAENISIFLYYSLIIGVLTEILSPVFAKIHKNSPKIITISEDFSREFREEISILFRFFAFLGGVFIIIFLATQQYLTWWKMDFYIYGAMILVILWFLGEFLTQKTSKISDFLEGKNTFFIKFLPKKYISYIFSLISAILAVYFFNGYFSLINAVFVAILVGCLVWILYFIFIKIFYGK